MTILVVDNQAERLRALSAEVQAVFPDDTVISHIDPLTAGKYSFNHPVDLLIAEVRMKRMDGPRMGAFVRRTNPDALVYLIAGPDEAGLHMPFHESPITGMLFRPITGDMLRRMAHDHDGLCRAPAAGRDKRMRGVG